MSNFNSAPITCLCEGYILQRTLPTTLGRCISLYVAVCRVDCAQRKHLLYRHLTSSHYAFAARPPNCKIQHLRLKSFFLSGTASAWNRVSSPPCGAKQKSKHDPLTPPQNVHQIGQLECAYLMYVGDIPKNGPSTFKPQQYRYLYIYRFDRTPSD